MILNQTATNDYFFQQGRLASCRYILMGPFDAMGQAQAIQNFFAEHLTELELYRQQHRWSITAEDILTHIHMEPRDDRYGPALLVDIPHYLLDAQRGLLCIDAAFREGHGRASAPLALSSRHAAEPYTVHSIALADYPNSTQQTITQAFLARLTPLLADGIRLVQNLEDKNPMEPGLGNGFATVNLDQEQLIKLTGSNKLLWKRFLDRTANRLRSHAAGEQQLPDRSCPLFTSVGKIPSAVLPLPNLSALVNKLFMFPSHIPQSTLTMTLYSYGSRLYFILSGKTENGEQQAITQLLLRMGWVLEATGE